MKIGNSSRVLVFFAILFALSLQPRPESRSAPGGLTLPSRHLSNGPLLLDRFYLETSGTRLSLPVRLSPKAQGKQLEWKSNAQDGHSVSVQVIPRGDHYTVRVSAQPVDETAWFERNK